MKNTHIKNAMINLNKPWTKPKGKSRMANPETLATLDTHRTKTNKTQKHKAIQETKRISITDPPYTGVSPATCEG